MNFDRPHKRCNPLTGEWILVSPHRTKRPWDGKVEDDGTIRLPQYDPECYLCPGNNRAGGEVNPHYEKTFVFTNDYSALLIDTSPGSQEGDFIRANSERGICKVVCFSPRHDLTLALMDTRQIESVVDIWIDQFRKLGAYEFIQYVQIFENRGALMGCSNPHPHGQIWSNETLPTLPAMEDMKQKEYSTRHSHCLLCDYLAFEMKEMERVIFENNGFVCLVPFWAVWPFEVMILPKGHLTDIAQMSDSNRRDLADAIRRIGIRFDNLFETSFPYSMGFHQRPTDGKEHSEWHFHIHYYPPLLRSATVKKFMVGYELLAMPQRDITAEHSAELLQECSDIHFTKSKSGS
jgi:UDPglucose--hexose-1-phosphate uridylyltransferase